MKKILLFVTVTLFALNINGAENRRPTSARPVAAKLTAPVTVNKDAKAKREALKKADDVKTSVIYEEDIPEGAVGELMESVSYGFENLFGELFFDYTAAIGNVYTYEYEEEGVSHTDLYLNDPVASDYSRTYVVAKEDLAASTDTEKYFTVTYPQDLYLSFDPGLGEYMVRVAVMECDEELGTFVLAPADKQTVTYVKDKDGVRMIFEPGETKFEDVPKYIVGTCGVVVNEDGSETFLGWTGNGDSKHYYAYFDDTVTYMPEDLPVEDWVIYQYNMYNSNIIKVAIDEANGLVYLGNTSRTIMDDDVVCGAAVGTIDGDKVTFRSGQCLGVTTYGWYMFFVTAVYEEVGQYQMHYVTDEIVMNYDREKKIMVSAEPYTCIFINSNVHAVSPETWYNDPVIKLQTEEGKNANPLNPVWYGFYEFSEEYDVEFNTAAWEAYPFNVNGCKLDGDRVYYRAYVNDELFTFDPAVYKGLTEPMTDIPFFFIDDLYDIFANEGQVSINFYDLAMKKVGLQMFYEGSDGNTYASEITSYVIPSAIENVQNDASPVSVEYFNLSGVKISEPQNGIYIRSTTYDNGSRSFQKVVVR